jgi:hypothetical protein
MTLQEKAAQAEREEWAVTLCSTGNYPDGCNHGAMIDHSAGTYTLQIFRCIPGSVKFEHHPTYGKCWKYKNGKLSASETLTLIRRVCDKIGLRVGSLKVYKNGPLCS